MAYYFETLKRDNCYHLLKTLINPQIIRLAKKYKNYNTLSQPFLALENIEITAEKESSFKHFIQALERI